MKDYEDRTDERARPLPGDRPVAGMPMNGADEGRGRTATEDHDAGPDKIILSSRTEDEQRDTTESGRAGARASQVEPGGPADPLGERTAGPAATARPYAPGGSSASTGSVMAPDAGTAADREDGAGPYGGAADREDGADTGAAGRGYESGTGAGTGAGREDGSGMDAVAGGTAAERLIGRDDADRFGSRWREVKAGFVDDPRDAVKQAGALCEEAVTAITTALEDQQRGLRERWNGDDADTERLRMALRAYGDLLDRLTSL
ncbi:hypothetical protein [Actinoallomurus rhizosphaericola]|uniref:hypothetical protein n=1 Tax=Actinoallomurus rhizosphaericola TaxID=2952536 RepID=UPI002092A5D2|nr:hypothetical protein [Actinoallomurus rhizosphaericola]MCO5998380.1 hypothetical protein [Actinoallomurus rhizosphaericola]